MSFFETECPMCGVRYYTGMVGMTLMGWHECEYQGMFPIFALWKWACLNLGDGYYTVRELHEYWPGIVCSFTWPGHDEQITLREYRSTMAHIAPA